MDPIIEFNNNILVFFFFFIFAAPVYENTELEPYNGKKQNI